MPLFFCLNQKTQNTTFKNLSSSNLQLVRLLRYIQRVEKDTNDMKKLLFITMTIFLFATFCFAQKGFDPQTDKIKKDGNKKGGTESSTVRSFNWGKGKTKVRDRLPNPYKMASRRDILVKTIINILNDNKFIVDESASRFEDGIVVTQPYVFARGPVTTTNELSRYARLPSSDTSWTRGRYTYRIEIQSIDGIQNNVFVSAKVEGRSANGLSFEWTTLESSGVAEDVFLSKLVEMVTGVSPDAPQTIDQ